MRRRFALWLCMSAGTSLNAQNEDSLFIRSVANEILLHGRAYENLRELTKGIGARLAGSPQMVRAEKWGAKALNVAKADTVWFQQCTVPHWVRGGKDVAFASSGNFKNRKMDAIALGNSMGSAKLISAPVIEVKDFDDLEKKKQVVKGKIIFYNYSFNPTFVRTFEAYADAVAYRVAGPGRAAKYGAKAVLVRSMSHSTDNIPHTGSTRYDSAAPKIPALAIGLQDADWLSAQLNKSPVTVSLQTYGRFLPDTVGHNVIAELKGVQFPNEYITIGGHLDSWDVGEGAHDDGAGIVQTIEVLRAFKALGYQPKRNIRFVLFANEENGLRGGNQYAQEAKARGEKHIFALESDAGGFTSRGFSLMAKTQERIKIEGWKNLLQPYGVHEFINGGGADIMPLNRTQETALAELTPDSQRYFDLHHTRNDVFENVNKRELELGAINMAALIYLVDKYGL